MRSTSPARASLPRGCLPRSDSILARPIARYKKPKPVTRKTRQRDPDESRGVKAREAPVGVEPTMADFQSDREPRNPRVKRGLRGGGTSRTSTQSPGPSAPRCPLRPPRSSPGLRARHRERCPVCRRTGPSPATELMPLGPRCRSPARRRVPGGRPWMPRQPVVRTAQRARACGAPDRS